MISLRREVEVGEMAERAGTLRRVASLIVEGLAVHATGSDPEELGAFQRDLRRFGGTLERVNATPAELLVTAGSLIQTCDQYYRRVEHQAASGRRELLEILELMTSTLMKVSRISHTSANNLRNIEGRLRTATLAKDIRTVKESLRESLVTLGLEVQRHRSEGAALMSQVQAAVCHPLVAEVVEKMPEDPVTGLPAKIKALEAIELAAASNRSFFAVAMRLGNLQLLVNRFGSLVGAEYMFLVSQLIAQGLESEDQLFRWNDASLLALMERRSSACALQDEVNRLVNARSQHSLTIDGRTVMIRINLITLCLPVWQASSVPALVSTIEEFAEEGMSESRVIPGGGSRNAGR